MAMVSEKGARGRDQEWRVLMVRFGPVHDKARRAIEAGGRKDPRTKSQPARRLVATDGRRTAGKAGARPGTRQPVAMANQLLLLVRGGAGAWTKSQRTGAAEQSRVET